MYFKTPKLRDKKWRRYVASLPCCACGLEGLSQAAHYDPLGGGMGLKACDTFVVPLCCTRPGEPGCHVSLDQQHHLPGMSREETERHLRTVQAELAAVRKGTP